MVVCRVVLLDQENFQVELAKTDIGQVLFDDVKLKLSLEEADYFGLSYRNSQNLRFWLNLEKRIDKQVESTKDMVFYWEVKFYPPAPEQLNEDLTRYLVVLQIRQDLFTGRLPASFQTQAILGSFTAQGEIGDFDRTQHIDIEYLTPYSFAPQQSVELLMRICDLHKTCKGLTPAEADLYFLENAKKCALYGMDLYNVKDSANNREVKIGVSACGLYVYHGRLRIECYKWPRILKIEYKRNVFRIKVRPAEFEQHQQTLGYQLPSVKLAKRLMRIAVENHQFFRLKQPELTDTSTLRGFGTRRWRLSGRTQSQLRGVGTPRKSFSRANSIMSSDTYPLGHSIGTMPVPASRRIYREPDVDKNYNTIAGHMNGSTDKRADISCEDGGEYLLNDSLDDSSKARDSNPQLHRRQHPDSGRRHPSTGSSPLLSDSGGRLPSDSSRRRPSDGSRRRPSEDNSGRLPSDSSRRLHSQSSGRRPSVDSRTHGTDNQVGEKRVAAAECNLLPDSSSRYNRTPEAMYRRPVPPQRSVSDLANGDGSSQLPVVENTVGTAAPQPQLSSVNADPTSRDVPKGANYQPAASPRYDSPGSRSPRNAAKTPDSTPRPSAAAKFGLGELPMPSFSLESAGVMPTGGVDHSVKLQAVDRAEKVIKVGVPPTVQTTCMKFAGGYSDPGTHSTWSPPTVKTEKRHFNYTPSSHKDLNGYQVAGHGMISETTTYTTERDGHIEKKVKHTITISGDDDIDNKLLLDAIQAVTGLDNTLGVDKIEIKTESGCP